MAQSTSTGVAAGIAAEGGGGEPATAAAASGVADGTYELRSFREHWASQRQFAVDQTARVGKSFVKNRHEVVFSVIPGGDRRCLNSILWATLHPDGYARI